MLGFEWDERKAQSNLAKHGVGFEEAASVFGDALAASFPDADHSTQGERRMITVGFASSGRLLFVSHVERGGRIRLVSARLATARERKRHEQFS